MSTQCFAYAVVSVLSKQQPVRAGYDIESDPKEQNFVTTRGFVTAIRLVMALAGPVLACLPAVDTGMFP